jgi:hypothetical protein
MSGVPGSHVDIVVSARADSDLVTSVDVELSLNHDIFLADDLRPVLHDTLQTFKITIPSSHLSPQSKVIARIPGILLNSAKAASVMILTNPKVDPGLCPLVSTSPRTLADITCAPALHAFRLISPLSAFSVPNPAADHLELHIQTSEQGPLELKFINVLGLQVKECAILHGIGSAMIDIDIADLACGQYLLSVRSGELRTMLNFVKSK